MDISWSLDKSDICIKALPRGSTFVCLECVGEEAIAVKKSVYARRESDSDLIN